MQRRSLKPVNAARRLKRAADKRSAARDVVEDLIIVVLDLVDKNRKQSGRGRPYQNATTNS